MSLRQITTSAILLVAFCTGLYFWGEWQKRKFDASLPKPPVVQQQTRAETETAGHWHDGEWHAEPHEVQVVAQDESNTSNGDEWLTSGDMSTGITTTDVDISERLTDSEIEELNQTLKRDGFHPEKLSQRQLDYLSVVGINMDMLPPKQRQQFIKQSDREFYGQYGLKPPPEGYSFSFYDINKGILNLDENGMPIVFDDRTGHDIPWAEVSAHFEGDPYVQK